MNAPHFTIPLGGFDWHRANPQEVTDHVTTARRLEQGQRRIERC